MSKVVALSINDLPNKDFKGNWTVRLHTWGLESKYQAELC